MGHPRLDALVSIGQLKQELAATGEIEGLLRSGRRRLDDARRKELSLESRFDLSYNAAHAFALAALRVHGYRSDSRYLVFQCLQHTVNLSAKQWHILDHARRVRNLAEYEGATNVDERLIGALMKMAEEAAMRLDRLIARG